MTNTITYTFFKKPRRSLVCCAIFCFTMMIIPTVWLLGRIASTHYVEASYWYTSHLAESVRRCFCVGHTGELCKNGWTDRDGMVWYGMVNVDLYSAVITKVSNALNTLVSGEKPGFQALSKGLIVLLCAEVVRQGVPDHGAVHSECSASNSG